MARPRGRRAPRRRRTRYAGGVRGEVDARQQRLVAGPVVEARRRDARRAEGPAVEPAAERDDAGPARHPAGELERAVDRLGAGVQEHHRVERVRHGRGEHRARRDGRLGEADRVDGPDQPVDLGVDRGRDPGVAWPSAVTAIPFAKSRYARPAVSYRRWPLPWSSCGPSSGRGPATCGRGEGREVEGEASVVSSRRV